MTHSTANRTDRRQNTTDWMSSSKKQQLVESWCGFVEKHVSRGWTPYLLTFQFREIGGPRQQVAHEMEKDVERVFATFLTRVVRNPTSRRSVGKLPIWIASPDYPVRKNDKQPVGDFCINDGRHIQGICLMPPKSRLKEPLNEHFEEYATLYVRAPFPLVLIDAEPITKTSGKATDYTLKALKSGRATNDEIVVLPRALTEVSRPS
ncbi:hypothetical protein [Methylocystis sp.]|uniref:hypothetical protein n=1 Tax=Methylocystis sp. TaxID=1911079 RepID=UPI0025ED8AAD|nr:hypothetical protein [Methylocystis sp.]